MGVGHHSSMKPVEIGPFNLGVNNRLPDTELTVPKVGAYLRSGVNIDLATTGNIKRRAGFTQKQAGSDCHSLYSDGEHAYMVDGTTLYVLNEAIGKTAIRSGLTPGARLSYADVNGRTIYTDGTVLRQLDGTDKPFGVPTLSPEPGAHSASGSLYAGKYQLCFTYLGSDGQQSGSTTPIAVDSLGAIVITGLPVAFPAGVSGLMVYMTSVNGDQLMLAHLLTTPQSELTITTNPQLGGRCPTLQLKPMPAGSLVRYNNGRLLVAVGNILHYSEPYALSLRNAGKNFIPFDAAITIIESVKTGTYVATETKSYYFAGDIAASDMLEVLPYGAVAGTGGASPDALKCWWMSTRGLVHAAEGAAKNVQEDNIAVNAAKVGASLFREHDGMKQIVTSTFGVEQTGAAAYTYLDAEIVRKKEIL